MGRLDLPDPVRDEDRDYTPDRINWILEAAGGNVPVRLVERLAVTELVPRKMWLLGLRPELEALRAAA